MSTIFLSQTTVVWRTTSGALSRTCLQIAHSAQTVKVSQSPLKPSRETQAQSAIEFDACLCNFEFRTPERMQLIGH